MGVLDIALISTSSITAITLRCQRRNGSSILPWCSVVAYDLAMVEARVRFPYPALENERPRPYSLGAGREGISAFLSRFESGVLLTFVFRRSRGSDPHEEVRGIPYSERDIRS